MSKLPFYQSIPESGGTVIIHYDVIGCRGKEVNMDNVQKRGNTGAITVSHSSSNETLTVTLPNLPEGQSVPNAAIITPLINGKTCGTITVTQEQCTCNRTKVFPEIIPQEGLPSGSKIGEISGGCPTSAYTFSSSTIHCVAQTSSVEGFYNIVLTQALSANPNVDFLDHIVEFKVNGVSCGSRIFRQEGDYKCDCATTLKSVTCLKTSWPLEGTYKGSGSVDDPNNYSEEFIGSGYTSCGLIKPITNSSVFSLTDGGDIRMEEDEDTHVCSFYAKIRKLTVSESTGVQFDLYDYLGERVSSCQTSISIVQSNSPMKCERDYYYNYPPTTAFTENGWLYYGTNMTGNTKVTQHNFIQIGGKKYYEMCKFSFNGNGIGYYLGYDETKFAFIRNNQVYHFHYLPKNIYDYHFAYCGDFTSNEEIKSRRLVDCEYNGYELVRYYDCYESTVTCTVEFIESCNCSNYFVGYDNTEIWYGDSYEHRYYGYSNILIEDTDWLCSNEQYHCIPFKIQNYFCGGLRDALLSVSNPDGNGYFVGVENIDNSRDEFITFSLKFRKLTGSGVIREELYFYITTQGAAEPCEVAYIPFDLSPSVVYTCNDCQKYDNSSYCSYIIRSDTYQRCVNATLCYNKSSLSECDTSAYIESIEHLDGPEISISSSTTEVCFGEQEPDKVSSYAIRTALILPNSTSNCQKTISVLIYGEETPEPIPCNCENVTYPFDVQFVAQPPFSFNDRTTVEKGVEYCIGHFESTSYYEGPDSTDCLKHVADCSNEDVIIRHDESSGYVYFTVKSDAEAASSDINLHLYANNTPCNNINFRTVYIQYE